MELRRPKRTISGMFSEVGGNFRTSMPHKYKAVFEAFEGAGISWIHWYINVCVSRAITDDVTMQKHINRELKRA